MATLNETLAVRFGDFAIDGTVSTDAKAVNGSIPVNTKLEIAVLGHFNGSKQATDKEFGWKGIPTFMVAYTEDHSTATVDTIGMAVVPANTITSVLPKWSTAKFQAEQWAIDDLTARTWEKVRGYRDANDKNSQGKPKFKLRKGWGGEED